MGYIIDTLATGFFTATCRPKMPVQCQFRSPCPHDLVIFMRCNPYISDLRDQNDGTKLYNQILKVIDFYISLWWVKHGETHGRKRAPALPLWPCNIHGTNPAMPAQDQPSLTTSKLCFPARALKRAKVNPNESKVHLPDEPLLCLLC